MVQYPYRRSGPALQHLPQGPQVVVAKRVDPIPVLGDAAGLVEERVEVTTEHGGNVGSLARQARALLPVHCSRAPEPHRSRRIRQHQFGEAEIVRPGAAEGRIQDRQGNRRSRAWAAHAWTVPAPGSRGGKASSEAVSSMLSERFGL